MAAPSVVARKKTKKTDTGCIVGKETIPVIKYVNQCTMHLCGMDFSSLASYWPIKALLMQEPSVVTPQNQYFPANAERMSVHCLRTLPSRDALENTPPSRQCTDTIAMKVVVIPGIFCVFSSSSNYQFDRSNQTTL